jgi:proteasome beta subunit
MDDELKNSILKSGTSIVGIVCKDGIVMAADRRATAGNIIVAKNTQKVVQVNDYLVASGTGMASDIDMMQKLVKAELKLKELRSKTRPTVKEGANLIGMLAYSHIRQFTTIPFIAGVLVAGVNDDGTTELYTVEPAGTVMKVEDYDANFGSGMPFMLGLLERQYKKDMAVKEGVQLAVECIKSSTQRDTGSGNAIDVFTITKQGIQHVVKQKIEAEYREEK